MESCTGYLFTPPLVISDKIFDCVAGNVGTPHVLGIKWTPYAENGSDFSEVKQYQAG